MNTAELATLRASGTFRFKTIAQGAATSVLAATSPQLEGIGGRYLEECNEAALIDDTGAQTSETVDYMPLHTSGVAAYALEPANASRLWQLSLAMVGS